MKIAVIPNTDKQCAIDCSASIAELLCENGATVLMSKELIDRVDSEVTFIADFEELIKESDCVVTVGGDGTIIHCAKYAAAYGKSIIGVNLGRLGYVAEIEPTEIQMLTNLISGGYKTIERMTLDVSITHSDGTKESYLAVNDAVISRGSLSRIIDLDVFVGDEKISNYRADGLLFSTPTGSTAYALSAGGPVIDPNLSLIELTPVCPHSLTARTVIFTDDTVLSVVCNSPDSTFLTIDGQISVPLNNTDIVCVRKSDKPLKMNVMKLKNFYRVAGEKLLKSE